LPRSAPPLIVTAEIETVPPVIEKTLLRLVPLIVVLRAPAPSIVRSVGITS